MNTKNIEIANIFSRISITRLTEIDSIFVTIHLIIRDNRRRFYFVKNYSPSEGKMNYEVIDFDTIILTDYPKNIQGIPTPSVEFLFATDENPTADYNNFELFIQFITKKVYPNMMALKFQGFNSNPISLEKDVRLVKENETDKGVVYFPDIKPK